MKYGLIGLVAAAFASKGMSAVLTQAGYEWFIANWTGHYFNITGPDFDYGTGGRSIPRFNAHCKGYGSYEYNEGYVPLRYAQCAVEPRWVTAGYWVRQPPPGSKQLTLGLVVRLSRGDETMWDLFSNVDQAYTRNDETLPAFSANITNASQVAYIDPS
ncbi:uncharacterized protein E0L32_002805 [Thyridium curvatum]|uniref:Uncharacterized protein n=1 Tax=Thyridium curvatum TaxID=1093900 RepID=A0A507BG12_9PEZI|nr:uncharacterized protein E0L32_002805 [Thyridium curvatum]TPX17704.1 hypothetical protein E0L32_002805 [Thyridium curvatum]